jgi:monothiol glutaredoxin
LEQSLSQHCCSTHGWKAYGFGRDLKKVCLIWTLQLTGHQSQKYQMTNTHAQIDNEVKTNDVVLFMKGTADQPMCGFSGRSVQILQHLGVPFKGVNVLADEALRNGIKDYTNWPTIPQLYVKGEFVGGADIMMEMFQSGELKQLMADKGVAE